ncbi:helix-turn-helix domain-containing protein [Streptomyces sp. NBC_01275]|uniref:helix-turn-helix domain-containing protein n=1 Tax=Streptomyces sp. NBC_01275 TaxID=2903807 RepID=UPI00225531CF|nr:helix-turn-helix domain-containing protein [Streptomyces sp. NBC_01275]MCX4762280.1 helix-turn-helix domain-containing protein [Streptomyces sp. NBC_01275]
MNRPRRRLETPIGAATLLLGFEHPVRISRAGRAPDTLLSAYCGATTTPAVGEHGGRMSGVEVLLTPWAGFTLFGTPQHELVNRTVDPDDLPHALAAHRAGEPRRSVGELAASLAALPSWEKRFGFLDDLLTHWWEAGTPSSQRVVRAWSELVRTNGAIPVPRLADEVGWSVRQLENRFREQIGLGPKAAARVLRLQRARRLLAAGRGAAETAALCGFYDQAHLSGEFKTMTGCTPREFAAARRRPWSTSPAADRLSGEATSLVLPARPTDPTTDWSGPGALFSKTRRVG